MGPVPRSRAGGRTLGLVGFRRIGQAVPRRASGFDMGVMAFDPFVPTDMSDAAGVRRTSLDEVVTDLDFVSLHLPGAPGEAHLVDVRLVGARRPGA
ncbi:NAD(P)-dependent oxidoreductase [Frigoribacterium sp. CFBP 13605]|uniref:NAD(P)-dependent oxidoreductase n=1 Tax=Frigoribacterium sp. CFBP 13605 TaxID=2774034 RepID=UPI001A9110E0